MTTRRWQIAAGLAMTAAGLSAQSGGGFGGGGRGVSEAMPFQQAATMNSIAPRATTGRTTSSGPLAVIGRPFSAKEERKSIQKLGDGTEIASSETNQFYRDSQGRTRVEQTFQGRTVIGILDPVNMVYLEVNSATRTVTKTTIPEGVTTGGISVAGGQLSRAFGRGGAIGGTYTISGFDTAVAGIRTAVPSVAVASGSGGGGGGVAVAGARGGGGAVGAGGGGGGRGGARGGGAGGVLAPTMAVNQAKEEELGVQSTNGLLAVGKRSTVTIPQGQIGNNRDIHIVNERWYSEDLGMTVKTVNSDPRFGDNIYELTDVSRSEPDPSLFQVPAGYTVVEANSGVMLRATPIAPVINK